MAKLRSTKKDNRIWWIVVVVVLGFGLVGSYAVWTGGGTISSTAGTNTQNTKIDKKTQTEQTIANTNKTIAQIEERLKNAKDPKEIGSLNLALGNYHYDNGIAYSFDLNKLNEGLAEFKAATDAYKEAVKYDDKNADLRVDYATAAMYSGQNDLAKEQFEAALKIDPKHLNGHYNYAIFLANSLKKYSDALAELNIAKDLAKNNKAYQDRINQVIQAVQAEANKPPVNNSANTTTGNTYGQSTTSSSTYAK